MSNIVDRIVSRLPADRQRDFLTLIRDLNVHDADLTQAYLAVEALAPMMAEINYAKGDIITGMRTAGAEIVSGLASDIADKSVEAIKVAVSTEIVSSVLAAKTSLELIAQQHRDTMTDKAGKFGGAAEAAVSKLIVAATDVRNHGAAIARLHLSHVIARAAWAIGGMVLAGAITFGGLHWYGHATCMATANRFSTHQQRLMLETEFCK